MAAIATKAFSKNLGVRKAPRGRMVVASAANRTVWCAYIPIFKLFEHWDVGMRVMTILIHYLSCS